MEVIGEKLKASREEKGLSLEEVSEDLKKFMVKGQQIIQKYGQIQKLALKEMEDEAVERIMKRISVEVQDNASKPLQDLDKQIRNLFSK